MNQESNAGEGRLWGARFASSPSAALANISRSPSSYFRLCSYDVAGSLAHADELERAGILSAEETRSIKEALRGIRAEVESGNVMPTDADEDVHGFLERLLIARLGDLGGKLRAGRSRNDQAANNLKLYLRDKARQIAFGVISVVEALVKQAEDNITIVAPGFTHLQPAQPILFSHQLLAHAQSLVRDIERLEDWHRRSDRSPLGAAALAGSAIAMHPELSARELGYSRPCENSIDAVASRDHVAEFLFVTSFIGVNISRLCEEICLWTASQFGWVTLSDSYSTGSSIMPQKKNPDIAELSRGMAGRLIGNLGGFLTTVKAMPLAYNRDLAEDKRAVFDTLDLMDLILPAMAGMISTMTVNGLIISSQATRGFTLATEVADWLARQGIPFSEAHEITGRAVRYCESADVDLTALSTEMLAEIDPRLTAEVKKVLSLDAAIAARAGYGGTSSQRVIEQLSRLRSEVERQRLWASS